MILLAIFSGYRASIDTRSWKILIDRYMNQSLYYVPELPALIITGIGSYRQGEATFLGDLAVPIPKCMTTPGCHKWPSAPNTSAEKAPRCSASVLYPITNHLFMP